MGYDARDAADSRREMADSSRRASGTARGPSDRRREVPDAAGYGLPVTVTCPFCGRDETELHSPFGPQLSVATYWCRRCHTAFDYLKWHEHRP